MDSREDGKGMNETKTFVLWVNMTIEAVDEDEAFAYAYEAMCLAEGQGLLDHQNGVVTAWSIEGKSSMEQMWTTCGKCEKMNIMVVEDVAPSFCEECCICGNCTPDGFDHDACLEGGSVERIDVTP